jgi:hypothetical protein
MNQSCELGADWFIRLAAVIAMYTRTEYRTPESLLFAFVGLNERTESGTLFDVLVRIEGSRLLPRIIRRRSSG